MTPADIVKGIINLVSLPEVCIRVNEMVDNPRYSAVDIGKVISQDVGLTTRLLKLANSPFYSRTRRIDTVSRAIAIIGMRELRDLVLATSAIKAFSRLPSTVVDMDAFWYHSIRCAVAAQILAAKCHVLHSERLFVAGLMHDLGHLVMYLKIPELVRVILARAQDAHESLHQAEMDVLGFEHGDVGAELMKMWKLPDSLREVAQFHHVPAMAEKYILETAIVHIANSIAAHMSIAPNAEPMHDAIVDPVAWKITGLSARVLDSVTKEADARVGEAAALLLPKMRMAR